MPNIKQVFSSYTATPQAAVSQVTILLDDETVLIYRPVKIQDGKTTYGWFRMPKLPPDINSIPFLSE